jgi:hypothetical protein
LGRTFVSHFPDLELRYAVTNRVEVIVEVFHLTLHIRRREIHVLSLGVVPYSLNGFFATWFRPSHLTVIPMVA